MYMYFIRTHVRKHPLANFKNRDDHVDIKGNFWGQSFPLIKTKF